MRLCLGHLLPARSIDMTFLCARDQGVQSFCLGSSQGREEEVNRQAKPCRAGLFRQILFPPTDRTFWVLLAGTKRSPGGPRSWRAWGRSTWPSTAAGSLDAQGREAVGEAMGHRFRHCSGQR